MITDVTSNMRFHRNGDYSGEVVFLPPEYSADSNEEFFEVSCGTLTRALLNAGVVNADADDQIEISVCRWRGTKKEKVVLPVKDIREFLAGRVQSERIRKLEEMTDEELDQLGRQDEYLRWAKEDE